MKPLAFNLKDAKKISGDKVSSTFVLKDGHQIRVAHAPLPALQKKQLEKLPIHLDVGGAAIGETPEEAGDGATVPAPPTMLAGMGPFSTLPTPGGMSPSDLRDRMLAQNQTGGATSDIPQSDPKDSGNIPPVSNDLPDLGAPVTGPQSKGGPLPAAPSSNLSGFVNKGQKGIQEQESYEKALSSANANSEQSDIDARQNLMDGFKRNAQDFQDEQKRFIQDYQNNKIDPNHYMESLTSGQKVAKAIGLFLGGWSSAYTHQGNPALDFLNKQIDRDIQAQQSRLDQQKTLLGANQELYHDNVLATNATRMQMNDIYAHQMQLNSAKLGTPAAKAKADMASAQWGLQNAQLLQQNAVRATVLHAIAQGGQGLDAQTLSAAGFMTPQQAEKEQSSINAQKTAVDSTKNLFQQMDKEQTVGNLLNPQSYSRVNALNAELVNTVMNASASKRLTRESIEAEIKPLEIRTTDTAATRKAKLDGVLNIIGKHADPTPMVSKYAPQSIPQYPFQVASAPPQYKVGDVLHTKSGQTLQIVNAKGDYRVLGGQAPTAVAGR